MPPQKQIRGPVFEDRIHRFDAVLLAEGAEPAASELHRTGGVRAQPEIAGQILVQRGDVEVTEAVSFIVRAKAPAIIAVEQKLCYAPIGRNPESTVGRLEELKYPFGGEAIFITHRNVDNRGGAGAISPKAEEAGAGCPRPQLSFMILEQVG